MNIIVIMNYYYLMNNVILCRYVSSIASNVVTGSYGVQQGWSYWVGGAASAPPHQLRVLVEWCKLPLWDPEQSPRQFGFWVLRNHVGMLIA